MLQTVQRRGVYSATYGTLHYKKPLKSFEIRVAQSSGFGLPSAVLSKYCHDCAEIDVKQYLCISPLQHLCLSTWWLIIYAGAAMLYKPQLKHVSGSRVLFQQV